MLGLQQDAPRGKLYVDPALPDWLPDVTLTDLRLGRLRFDIRFWRDGKDTVFKVLRESETPWSRAIDYSRFSQAYLNGIALRLNQRPRKTLAFETPANRLQLVLH